MAGLRRRQRLLSCSNWGCRVNLSYAGAASVPPGVGVRGERQTVASLGVKSL